MRWCGRRFVSVLILSSLAASCGGSSRGSAPSPTQPAPPTPVTPQPPSQLGVMSSTIVDLANGQAIGAATIEIDAGGTQTRLSTDAAGRWEYLSPPSVFILFFRAAAWNSAEIIFSAIFS